MKLTSASLSDGDTIPRKHTADGVDVSPPLTWTGRPPGTQSFALVCEDPDAPRGLFTHWLIWNINGSSLRDGLPKEPSVEGLEQGENGFGRIGWGGPRPPHGETHRYVFRLLALDTTLSLRPGARRADFDRAIEGHILGEATLTGMYAR
jgi:hypothetical protein